MAQVFVFSDNPSFTGPTVKVLAADEVTARQVLDNMFSRQMFRLLGPNPEVRVDPESDKLVELCQRIGHANVSRCAICGYISSRYP